MNVEIVGVTSVRLSDGTVWPLPVTEADQLGWRLTYATPSQDDLHRAARIISAYGYLLTETNRQRRDQVCRDMRVALSAPRTSSASTSEALASRVPQSPALDLMAHLQSAVDRARAERVNPPGPREEADRG